MKNIGAWFRLPPRYGVLPYIFLLYLIFPILSIQELGLGLKILGYALVLVFVAIYRQLYWCPNGRTYSLLLLGMIAIIVAFSQIGGLYNLYLGFFTATFIGGIRSKKTFKIFLALSGLSMVVMIALHLNELSPTDLISLFPIVMVLLLLPFGMRSVNRQIELRKQLDAANEQIGELMKKEERMRIARDLHDTLGHTLSLITLKSQLAERMALKDPERARQEAQEIQETSRAALRQVRELVSEMRAIKLSEELIEAREMLRTASMALHVKGESKLQGVPDLTQNILSLCLKEAVTNIVKHSRAENCTVTIFQSGSEVGMNIEDDGVGLDARKDSEPGGSGLEQAGGGNGLEGMRERLALIEGKLELMPRAGKGTLLSVSVPLVVRTQQGGVMS
ncbi:two-component sensor histidine kinase [Saccharibacillus sp. O23]|uniref:sensor histidine kinase n=1 Tax=Saccharibacillus sp. O23 TaxID=2009338 RepID=UPI000B4E39AE|nr:sensor histidine kinase [Saccharibacillus sp. O23]OWR26691.1 two-component sensor histidine kinase [Saccharibacillus sp. O23]